MKKLTLSADDEVIEQAKRIAAESGTSVSAMFQRFIRAVDGGRRRSGRPGVMTRKATGVIALPDSRSPRQVLEEALAEKYEP